MRMGKGRWGWALLHKAGGAARERPRETRRVGCGACGDWLGVDGAWPGCWPSRGSVTCSQSDHVCMVREAAWLPNPYHSQARRKWFLHGLARPWASSACPGLGGTCWPRPGRVQQGAGPADVC